MSMKQQFFKYVSQNIAGMIGISIYILADTFFIALHSGANGITVLNLVLPLYGLLYGIGAMIGIGSATRHAIRRAQGDKNIDFYFSNALFWQFLCAVPFILVGLTSPESYLRLMGGDVQIVELGLGYARIVFLASPFFMMNYTFTAFARNDNATTNVMAACLAGSLFNIVFDYIFMFPMNGGLEGAALATMVSPVVTMSVTCIHYLGKKGTLKWQWKRPDLRNLWQYCQLGISAFVGEVSSAITTAVFNLLILGLTGNIGVAAYGVVANLSLIAMCIVNGVAQGTQPLLSESYGHGKPEQLKTLLRWGIYANLILAALILLCTWGMTDALTAIFNSEGDPILAGYAHTGLRLYFLGYLPAGINIMLVTYFSATDRGIAASVNSILRGAVAVVICAILMASWWGMNGIWLSFLAAEGITTIVILIMFTHKY